MESQNVYNHIADQLLQKIQEGAYPVGKRLPAERQLAEQFGVSRTTIREAIRLLISYGVIETRAGAGSYVRAPDKRQISDNFFDTFLQDNVTNYDVIETRQLLDAEIAAIAAVRRTAEQLQELKQNVADARACVEAGGNASDYMQYDMAFHLLLGKATNNPVLSKVVDMCSAIYSYTVGLSCTVKGMPMTGLLQHEELLKAIEQRDSKKARAIMKAHILRTLYYV